MKAIVLREGSPPRYTNIADAVADSPDWALIRPEAVGLCGSDVQKIMNGRFFPPYLMTPVLGHEMAGTIAQIYDKERGFRTGEQVTATPLIPCESCTECVNERYQTCDNLNAIGRTLPGAFAEYVAIPVKNLRRIPPSINLDAAALTDVVAVAVHTYHLASSPEKQRVVIIGDGPVGLLAGQLFARTNATSLVGKHERNLMVARQMGMEAVPLTEAHFLPRKHYDVVVEMVGGRQSRTMDFALDLVRPRGKIVVGGVFEPEFRGTIRYRDWYYGEASIVGANSYGRWRGENEFDSALELIEKGIVTPTLVITHHLSLARFNEGLELLRRKESSQAIKILYVP